MASEAPDDGIRARFSRQGEDALGRFAQELLESPLLSGALSRAFDAREKAAQAQELAMGALNLPSAGDLERLTRRVRSVSQRLEGVEDALDRVEQRLAANGGGAGTLEQRLAAIEQQLARLAALTRRQLSAAEAIRPTRSAAAVNVSTSTRPRVDPSKSLTTSTQPVCTPRRAPSRNSVAVSISTASASVAGGLEWVPSAL
jgi:hypothetical protein